MGLRIGGRVERVDGRKLTYEDFSERYLKPNCPVVLTGLMDEWRACRDWVTDQGYPNLRFFADHFGGSTVQVADCCKRDSTDQKRIQMSVSEFINYWVELAEGTTNGLSCSNIGSSLLYLKDWHFVKEYPKYVAYTAPPFFVDDWLNLYLDSHLIHRDSDIRSGEHDISCSDYRFVYMGAKGTWTPLHADVFRSYSWSANVCGKKLWYLLPPSESHLVFDRNIKNTVYDIFDDVSEAQFPGFKKTVWLECVQEQNEIIFVPSGWYHQVHNMEDTISINHNWFNAFNLSWVWNLLVHDYNEAKEYIEDIRDICDDFESICQRNLALNTGMNFYDFFILLTRFTLANLVQLCHLRNEKDASENSSIKSCRLISNLKWIQLVATAMDSLEAFAVENLKFCSEENQNAFSDVQKILCEPEFIKLRTTLVRAYGLIGDAPNHYHDELISEDSESSDYVKTFRTKICRPDDLVKMIDLAITHHCSLCCACTAFVQADSCDLRFMAR